MNTGHIFILIAYFFLISIPFFFSFNIIMAPLFDDMPLGKEALYPVKGCYSFLNFFQKQAKKFSNNIYIRYQVVLPEGDVTVKTLTYEQG